MLEDVGTGYVCCIHAGCRDGLCIVSLGPYTLFECFLAWRSLHPFTFLEEFPFCIIAYDPNDRIHASCKIQ